MRHQSSILLISLALLALSGYAQKRDAVAEERSKLEEFIKREEGCADARALDYVRRHGDKGRIEPEWQLYLSRIEMEERERLARSVQADAIGGSVWMALGPNNGAGRVNSVTTHPTIAGTTIIGSAGGGAWKTTNGGTSWTPLTDSIPNLSVGAVAYAPSSPNIVYLGSGEPAGSSTIGGIGLLVSNDGGATWNLPSSVIAWAFYKISVHPANANELVIATTDGAFRSTNGQAGPWTQVLTGSVHDLVRDPSNAQILYATRGFEVMPVWKSTDGGQTWNPSSNSLPDGTTTSRWSIAIAPSNTQVLYALTSIDAFGTGDDVSHLYKSTNGGALWSETGLSTSPEYAARYVLGHQSWYDNTLVVAPNNAEVVIAGGVLSVRSTDGGANWEFCCGSHADFHDLRYDAGGTLWFANDGGIWTSPNDGTTLTERNTGLVTRQYYAIAIDGVNRNRILGGTQDNGTNRRTDAGGTSWDEFSYGDGFDCEINPYAPDVAYSTIQYGEIHRGSFTKTVANMGSSMIEVTPPFQSGVDYGPFFTQLKMDPTNPAVLYTGTVRLWKSSTGGDAWAPLPTNVTGGETWNPYSIGCIAVAPANPQILMIAKGFDIYRSTDGGQTWTRQSDLNGLPGWWVNWVEIDPLDSNRVFAAISSSYIETVYFSIDGGTTWNPRGFGLPNFAAQVIRFDPTDPQTLYCGTDVGVYRTTNSGASWSRFGTMPAVAVEDLEVLPDGSMLRAGTHGRGAWELNVTGVTNAAPSVSILSPGGTTITKGETLVFKGTASDPDDAATSLQSRWTFPDDWSSISVGAASTVSHTFRRAGAFAVTLTTTDSDGATRGAHVFITVRENADDCATPTIIPGSGPFPYSIALTTETATEQPSDVNALQCNDRDTTLWLSFTPAVGGPYTFALCGATIAADLAAGTGSACGPYTSTGLCMFKGDEECAVQSTTLTAGTTYRLRLTSQFLGPFAVTVTLGNSAPSPYVASIHPFNGPTSGGTPVTITGAGFVAGATVTIGGVVATNVNVLTEKIITAVTPAHAVGAADVAVTNPSASPATLGRGFIYPMIAPTNLAATATSTTSVTLTWSPSSGAYYYEVARSTGGAFTTIGTPGTASFTDSAVSANAAYIYLVRAISAAGDVSPYGSPDLATTVLFTNDPLVVGSTLILATHITQLRTAVNVVRAAAGLGPATFTDASLTGIMVKAVHLAQLRTALEPARAALGLGLSAWTRPALTGLRVLAADVTELRNGVK